MSLSRSTAPKHAPDHDRVGRYRVTDKLGEGGYGLVAKAIHTETGEHVALKELARTDASALARFKNEFRALQDLRHPNLVQVHELLEFDGRWFIAMQLVQGCEWMQWVRPAPANHNGPDFNEVRLRATLGGIAQGLRALHAAGLVHRDLKPSNILVTPEGRAVLLDFGLVTSIDDARQSRDGSVVGSGVYMAPEQASGQAVGPAADWYGVGVCLYQAITGSAPFEGSRLQVMLAKQGALPREPRASVVALPADLNALSMALLAPLPDDRAGAKQVLEIANQITSQGVAEQTALAPPTGAPFAGRRRELADLDGAFSATLAGAARQVIVEGESGIGKSALVEEFLARLSRSHPEALVLRGRCYENETVPFKGFDGVMDALARHLDRLAPRQCEAVLPRGARVLAQLFPVLRGIRPLTAQSLSGISAEPAARRLAALDSLKRLFQRLRDRQPVVVVVDDLQWSDEESFRIFDLLAHDLEAPPLLLLCTCRPLTECAPEIRAHLSTMRADEGTRVVSLSGLTRTETRELTTQLLGEGSETSWVQQVVAESSGHPLFVAELVSHAQQSRSGRETGGLTLDEMVVRRAEQLGPEGERVLRLVTLAGSPKSTSFLATASGIAASRLTEVIRQLRAQRFVRSGMSGLVRCYHDRIRRAVAESMAPQQSVALHADLARACVAEDVVNAAEAASHLLAAGDDERALHWLQKAGDQALQTLGFARAANLFERSLELDEQLGSDPGRRCALWLGLASAQARGGHSAAAANSYRRAAQGLDGDQALECRLLAAQQLIHAGQLEDGTVAARAVLQELELPAPSAGAAVVGRVLWDTLAANLSDRPMAELPPQAPAEERRRLDALFALCFALNTASPALGAVLTTHYYRRALKHGDASDVTCALATRGIGVAVGTPNKPQKAAAIFERAEVTLQMADRPVAEAYLRLNRGLASLVGFRLEDALNWLLVAEQLIVEKCPGEPFLLTNLNLALGAAHFSLGQHEELACMSERFMREAHERSDLFGAAVYSGLGCAFVRHLREDRPDTALAELQELADRWPAEPVSTTHTGQMFAIVSTLLYQGGESAWQWHTENRERCEGNWVMRIGSGRDMVLASRVSAALAAHDSEGQLDKPVRRAAKTDLRAMLRQSTPFCNAYQPLLSAQWQVLEGQKEQALASTQLAHQRLKGLAPVYAPAAIYLLGLLEGGEAGEHKRKQALEAHGAQGYVNPRAALRFLGLPALEALERHLL